ncbi:hypothetical protein JYU34_017304 [Plutella xylostella]|uniref:Ashwin n=1 Tax=Plutella xylostella TaxID=51655 RepID=A0ABQ7Q0T4_PLUXY|nr:hypothetical protein JYU34_017304 [Plutella xylostella]
MSVPCDILLHPYLLSNQQLISSLQERHLCVNLEEMDRDHLLELFHHYCVPLSQRRYRDSGRGRILNKNRNLPADSTPDWVKSENLNKAVKHHSERIKPPPDLLSGHIKRIKISVEVEATPMTQDSHETHKRKYSMDTSDTSANNVETPAKRQRKHQAITWP